MKNGREKCCQNLNRRFVVVVKCVVCRITLSTDSHVDAELRCLLTRRQLVFCFTAHQRRCLDVSSIEFTGYSVDTSEMCLQLRARCDLSSIEFTGYSVDTSEMCLQLRARCDLSSFEFTGYSVDTSEMCLQLRARCDLSSIEFTSV